MYKVWSYTEGKFTLSDECESRNEAISALFRTLLSLHKETEHLSIIIKHVGESNNHLGGFFGSIKETGAIIGAVISTTSETPYIPEIARQEFAAIWSKTTTQKQDESPYQLPLL